MYVKNASRVFENYTWVPCAKKDRKPLLDVKYNIIYSIIKYKIRLFLLIIIIVILYIIEKKIGIL